MLYYIYTELYGTAMGAPPSSMLYYIYTEVYGTAMGAPPSSVKIGNLTLHKDLYKSNLYL